MTGVQTCALPIYAGSIGNIGVYSYNGNKIITTGGGGMVVSHSERHVARVRHLSTQAKTDVVYFKHDEIGYNYRMTNLQAALGLAQMEQLEGFLACKKENYRAYQAQGIALLPFREDAAPNYWFYSYLSERRDELIVRLEQNGIQSRPIWHLIHQLPHYAGAQHYYIERAPWYWERVVNIPCSTNLTEEQLTRVATAVRQFGCS